MCRLDLSLFHLVLYKIGAFIATLAPCQDHHADQIQLKNVHTLRAKSARAAPRNKREKEQKEQK
jgi:hypothetical protein